MEVVVGDYKFKFVKWASISVHKRYTKVQRRGTACLSYATLNVYGKTLFSWRGTSLYKLCIRIFPFISLLPAPGVKIRKSSDAYNKTTCQSLIVHVSKQISMAPRITMRAYEGVLLRYSSNWLWSNSPVKAYKYHSTLPSYQSGPFLGGYLAHNKRNIAQCKFS